VEIILTDECESVTVKMSNEEFIKTVNLYTEETGIFARMGKRVVEFFKKYDFQPNSAYKISRSEARLKLQNVGICF
jgi:hypothetical protein